MTNPRRWERLGQRVLRGVACAVVGALLLAAHQPTSGATAAGATGRDSGATAPAAEGERGRDEAGDELVAFLRIEPVAGSGRAAGDFIRARLGSDLPVHTDARGNLTVTVGAGRPRRLIACPLGEPGLVVARVEGDGYLRLALAGLPAPAGALWQQSYEGQVVRVAGAKGNVPGVVAARSIHLRPRGEPAEPPFTIADAWVDVGAESAAEAAELGIRPRDPVTLERRPVRLAGGLVAGPAAAARAACLAEVRAARRWRTAAGRRRGTVVFAWTAGDLADRSGIDALRRANGPFSEVVLLTGGPGEQRPSGSSSSKTAPAGLRQDEAPLDPAHTTSLRVPARFAGSQVETVATSDLERLSSALVAVLGGSVPASEAGRLPAPSRSPAPVLRAPATVPATASRSSASRDAAVPPGTARHADTAEMIGGLVAAYGVSGDEAAVRTAIIARLPRWARPAVDWAGNLTVTANAAAGATPDASGPVLFMAHMDEIGFRVSEVLPDGRLRLQARGGLDSSLWEGQAALVHGRRGPVPALFEPRPEWFGARRRLPAGDLVAFLGDVRPRDAATLGIQPGAGVTIPRSLLRLGRHRATAGALDDRAGAATLLLALRRIDPARLLRRVTFAWTTREEIGYLGAAALAHGREGYRRVYPIDAAPTSDSPREPRRLADLPLGRGAVLPAAAPRALLAPMLDLARRRGIAVRLGVAAGGNDGVPFQGGDAAVLPLSWPCRSTHTPAEVADLRDLEALADLIAALAAEGL